MAKNYVERDQLNHVIKVSILAPKYLKLACEIQASALILMDMYFDMTNI